MTCTFRYRPFAHRELIHNILMTIAKEKINNRKFDVVFFLYTRVNTLKVFTATNENILPP